MDSIPQKFQRQTLDTTVKKSVWAIRINVNQLTEGILEHIKTKAEAKASSCFISNLETGKHNGKPHYHIVLTLFKESSQSSVAKNYILHYDKLVHMEDYAVLPSAHYFDDSKSIALLEEYSAKSGISWNFGKKYDRTKNKEIIKCNLDKKQKEFRESEGLAEDLPMVLQYEHALNKMGEALAKALYPNIHFKTEGKSVRKQAVNDKWFDPNMREGDIFNLWIYGGAGLGKNALLSVLYPGCYKKAKSQYWERYNYKDHTIANNHMCVHFDEICTLDDIMVFDEKGRSTDAFKIMFCEDPFPVSIKHEAQETIRFKVGIVTSNSDIESISEDFSIRIHHAWNSRDCKDPLFGLDGRTLEEALTRRFTRYHIDDLHEIYKTFCYKKDPNGFGGVFMKSFAPEITERYNQLYKTYAGCTGDKKLEFRSEVRLLCSEMRNRTIQALERFRWVHPEVVKTIDAPLEAKTITIEF